VCHSSLPGLPGWRVGLVEAGRVLLRGGQLDDALRGQIAPSQAGTIRRVAVGVEDGWLRSEGSRTGAALVSPVVALFRSDRDEWIRISDPQMRVPGD